MLLQVMTEEKTNGFKVETVEGRLKKINAIGEDPWQVKEIEGNVKLKRNDAKLLKVVALNELGVPVKKLVTPHQYSLATYHDLLSDWAVRDSDGGGVELGRCRTMLLYSPHVGDVCAFGAAAFSGRRSAHPDQCEHWSLRMFSCSALKRVLAEAHDVVQMVKSKLLCRVNGLRF